MSAFARHRLPAIVLLTFAWVALWRGFTVGLVLSGIAIATGIVLGAGSANLIGGATVRPLAALRYLGRFLRDLAVASAVVAWEVLTPGDGTRTGIVAAPITGGSDIVTTIVANTLSLVPGTLTVDARRDPAVLYVHVLHLRDPEDVRAEVRRLEHLAIRAFGTGRAVEQLDAAAATPPDQEPRR